MVFSIKGSKIKFQNMKSLNFKNNDQMPILGLGTWKSEKGEVYKAVQEAINIGYRHFDCAFIYMNEKEIGNALKDAVSSGDVKREELWITSKLWNNEHKKEDVMPALQRRLDDLGLDYLDLYLMHWPVANQADVVFASDASGFLSLEEAPLSETWAGLEACVAKGMTKHIGVSNYSVKKLKALSSGAKIKPEVNQIELHPLLQQKEMLNYCKTEGINLIAYSPLGSRDRTPEMKAANEPDMFENPMVNKLAIKYDCTPAQFLIAWAINRGTAVIPKSTNPERLKLNFEAAKIEINLEDMIQMESLDKHYRYVKGNFFELPGSPYTVKSLWDE